MTPEAIAARCGYPLEIVVRGIAELEKPDPRSRTPDEDGRRIIPLEAERNWGWKITNYEKYEKIRSAEERREYFRLKKQEQRAKVKELSTPVHTVHQGPPPNLNPQTQPKRTLRSEDRLETVSEKRESQEAMRRIRMRIGKEPLDSGAEPAKGSVDSQ
jgi:hypothetical protein